MYAADMPSMPLGAYYMYKNDATLKKDAQSALECLSNIVLNIEALYSGLYVMMEPVDDYLGGPSRFFSAGHFYTLEMPFPHFTHQQHARRDARFPIFIILFISLYTCHVPHTFLLFSRLIYDEYAIRFSSEQNTGQRLPFISIYLLSFRTATEFSRAKISTFYMRGMRASHCRLLSPDSVDFSGFVPMMPCLPCHAGH